jgi:hypothetical protein
VLGLVHLAADVTPGAALKTGSWAGLGGGTRFQWALCCTSDSGVLAKLKGKDGTTAKRALAGLVSRILDDDERFSDIRWYPNGWRGGRDEPWKRRPRLI